MTPPEKTESNELGALSAQVAELQSQLAEEKARRTEAEEVLRAIHEGEVDALLVQGQEGEQVFSLKGAETPYRLLLEALNEGALTLSRDGTILYCNGRFPEMAQRPMEGVVGSTCRECLAPGQYRRFQQLMEQAQRQGAKAEFLIRCGDGTFLPVEISIRPCKVDETLGFSVLVTDITERKKAEHALREANELLEERVNARTAELKAANKLLVRQSEELTSANEELQAQSEELATANEELQAQTSELRFQAERLHQSELKERRQREYLQCIIAHAGTCIAVVQGQDLRYVLVNPVFQAVAGARPMVGRRVRDVFPEAAAAGIEAHLRRVLETGQTWKLDHYRAPIPGKPDATWHGQVVRLPMIPREEPSILVVIWDVTERERMEEALVAAKEELAQANIILEQKVQERTAKLQELVGELEHFSYTITHDMRAPLRSMRGFAELVLELGPSSQHAEQKSLLQRIINSAERMDLLITDALSYTKAIRQELPLGPVDVGALLRDMLDSYPEFQTANADIHLQDDIPLVLGNQAGLTQCFSNLLGNAIKFVEPGKKPVVHVRAETRPIPAHDTQPSSNVIRIWVEDNGIGIAESMQRRIFNMFARGGSQYEGNGIGLALVRKVVDRMGGRVGVESQRGKGSRFWIELLPGEPRKTVPVILPTPPSDAKTIL